MNHKLKEVIESFDIKKIPESRKPILGDLVSYTKSSIESRGEARLNFICTHNSRRSQFSQVWAQTFADHFELPVKCFSGGVEVTEFNPRAIASLERFGFAISSKGDKNPKYQVRSSQDGSTAIIGFSKIFDDPINPTDNFGAIMTCSHADENCPFIPGAQVRIPLNYEDPKNFDGTDREAEAYDERSVQIGTEMLYVFGQLK